MAIDKLGWTTDTKANVRAKQERFIHGGALSPQHAAFQRGENAKGALTSKLKKVAGASGVGRASRVVRV